MSSLSSFGNFVEKVKELCNLAVSAIIGNIFSAIFTFFFALGLFLSLLSHLVSCKWKFFSYFLTSWLNGMCYPYLFYALWSGICWVFVLGFIFNHWFSVSFCKFWFKEFSLDKMMLKNIGALW
jgi:hypothetical protein